MPIAIHILNDDICGSRMISKKVLSYLETDQLLVARFTISVSDPLSQMYLALRKTPWRATMRRIQRYAQLYMEDCKITSVDIGVVDHRKYHKMRDTDRYAVNPMTNHK